MLSDRLHVLWDSYQGFLHLYFEESYYLSAKNNIRNRTLYPILESFGIEDAVTTSFDASTQRFFASEEHRKT